MAAKEVMDALEKIIQETRVQVFLEAAQVVDDTASEYLSPNHQVRCRHVASKLRAMAAAVKEPSKKTPTPECGICGYNPRDCNCLLIRAKKICGIRAAGGMVGFAPCDLEWGHDGEQHASKGDGFYSRNTLEEHQRRQRVRKEEKKSE